MSAHASSPSGGFLQVLEQHVHDGLSPDLALDLALNELVVAATSATQASGAAVALTRGAELVCRATTGDHAPDLGVPLKMNEGLSGACIRSGSSQLCTDTESDTRVDSMAVRRLGIRSILVVPIPGSLVPIGIIEVFSPRPDAFSKSEELTLQTFALECAALRQRCFELAQGPPRTLGAEPVGPDTEIADAPVDAGSLQPSELDLTITSSASALSSTARNKPRRIDTWTLVLSCLVIAATLMLMFLIGMRTGFFRSSATHQQPLAVPVTPAQVPPASSTTSATVPAPAAPAATTPANPGVSSGPALTVYEGGKMVFREKPRPGAVQPETPAASPDSTPLVWLSPQAAEARVRNRVEPDYPPEARANHVSGDVTLEIVVQQGGSVGSVRSLSGNSLLSQSAAAAVSKWHYDPLQVKGQPTAFQTDVTLQFSLPRQ